MSNMPSSPGESWIAGTSSGQTALQTQESSRAGDYASFWRRLIASWLDFIIIGILLFICRLVLNAIGLDWLTAPIFEGTISAWWTVFVFNESMLSLAVGTLYFGYQESSVWQVTLGKRALGIIVTDLDGERISPARAVGRHLATLLSSAIFFIGYLIQPFTRKRQALHDIIASTVVLRK